jgi:hypothetical protein
VPPHVEIAPGLLVDRQAVGVRIGAAGGHLSVHLLGVAHPAGVEEELADVQQGVGNVAALGGLPDNPGEVREGLVGPVHLHQRVSQQVEHHRQLVEVRIAAHDQHVGVRRLFLPALPLLQERVLLLLDRLDSGLVPRLLGGPQASEDLVAVGLVVEVLGLVPVEARQADVVLGLARIVLVGGLDQLVQGRDGLLQFVVGHPLAAGREGPDAQGSRGLAGPGTAHHRPGLSGLRLGQIVGLHLRHALLLLRPDRGRNADQDHRQEPLPSRQHRHVTGLR